MVDDSSFVGISYRDRFHGDHLCSMGAFPTLVILDRQQNGNPKPGGIWDLYGGFSRKLLAVNQGKTRNKVTTQFFVAKCLVLLVH